MVIYFLLFAIVPATIITAFTVTTNSNTLVESKNETSTLQVNTLTGLGNQYANIVNNWVYQNSKTIDVIAQDPLIRENLPLLNNPSTRSFAIDKINQLFGTWVNSNSAMQEMMLLNYTSGDVIISRTVQGVTNTSNNKASDPYFIGAKANQGMNVSSDKVFFKQIYFSSTTNSLMMDFSKVVRSNVSNTVDPSAILVARIIPSSLYDIIAPRDGNGNPVTNFYSSIGLGKTGEIYLINLDGFAISRSRFQLTDNNFILKQQFTNVVPFEKAINQGYISGIETNYLGQKVFGMYIYLGKNTVSTDIRTPQLLSQLAYNLPWVLVVEINQSEVLAPVNKIQNEQTNSLLLILGIISLVGLIVFIASLVISNSFTKPIINISNISELVSKGDLTVNIEETAKKDEIGTLQTTFKSMIEFLKPSINSISFSAKALASSAQELASSSEEVNASSEELASVAQQISRGAQEQTSLLNTSVQKLNSIEKQFSNKINEIMSASRLIENISKQVNMLSLNASIEAARAGEYGRGFSIVAENIRRLADDVKGSVEEVNRIINNLTDFITKGMTDVSSSMMNVITVSEENASGSEEASASTEEQAATMEELSASAQELAKISINLEDIVRKFKID